MSEAPMSPRRRRRQARLMRIVNVPMRRLLSLPFDTPISRRLMLLFYTGRKTGRPYRQPVSYVEDGDVLLTPGGGRWKLNLREGEPIRVRLRGHDVQARPELVRDPGEVESLLRRMMAVNPRLASFVPFIGPGEDIDPNKLRAAIEYGFCIVRWHVADRVPVTPGEVGGDRRVPASWCLHMTSRPHEDELPVGEDERVDPGAMKPPPWLTRPGEP